MPVKEGIIRTVEHYRRLQAGVALRREEPKRSKSLN